MNPRSQLTSKSLSSSVTFSQKATSIQDPVKLVSPYSLWMRLSTSPSKLGDDKAVWSSHDTVPLVRVSQSAQKAAAIYRQKTSLVSDGKISGSRSVKGLPKDTSPLVLTCIKNAYKYAQNTYSLVSLSSHRHCHGSIHQMESHLASQFGMRSSHHKTVVSHC